ncbi:helix-turn-helix transcriptional regulator [uncultured Gemella sp.]|uniref:helix-turn-helix domain-containing protein n=1 Tax=uncultured Gemella sp. TaxID=254352 RepID=UPI0028D7D16B|nr:helix-turn-helix transcriptional regulator [uncultured Gemella sp.]
MKFNVDKIKVGERIFNIRNNLNLTLEQFGKDKDINAERSNASKWERGATLPNRSRLKAIAKKGNMTVNELLYGSIDEFLDNNLVSILEYQTGNKVSSNEEYSIARLQFKKWLEDRNITLENINYIYDYIDQNNASWNPWHVDIEYLKTMESIRVNMQDGTYSLVPLIEMLTEKDRIRVSKYILKILKNYQLTESDKKYIASIENNRK